MKKRILALALMAVMIVGVTAGCGSSSSPASESPQSTAAPEASQSAAVPEATPETKDKPFAGTTIRFLVTRHTWLDEVKKVLSQFEEETGIKVNVEEVSPEDQLNNKLTVESTAGGKALDVFMTRPLQEGLIFHKNGWYMDLTDLSNGDADFDVNDFFVGTRELLTYDGKLFSIPLVSERNILYYRKDLFEAQNIKVPTTFDELMETAKVFQETNPGMVGIAMRGQQSPAVTKCIDFLRGFGGDYQIDGKAVVNTPEAVKGFTFYGDLLRLYGPQGSLNMSWPEAAAVFSQGKAGMFIDADSIYNSLIDPEKSVIADKIGFAALPAGPVANKPSNVCSWALAIGANTQNKDASWEFIKWVTSKDISKQMLKSGQTITRTSAWEDPDSTSGLPSQMVGVAIESNKIGAGIDRPRVINVGEARDIVGAVIVAAIEGGDVQAAADKANAEYQKLIDKEAQG